MLNHSVQSLLISIYYHVLKSHNNKNNLNNENKKKKQSETTPEIYAKKNSFTQFFSYK